MKSRFSIALLLAFFGAFGINTIEAQTKETKKIVIKKKTIDADGNETIEIKELEGEDAELFILEEEGADGEEIEIEIEMEGGDSKQKNEKAFKIMTLDSDGKQKVIEWDGEGEMPEEVKSLIKEHEIDLDGIQNQSSPSGHKKVKAKFIGEDGTEEILEWNGEGEMPEDIKKMMEEKGVSMEMESQEERYKIKIQGDDGEMKVMEWDGEGEMPEEMKAIMKEHEIDVHQSAGSDQATVKVIQKHMHDENTNKAQLGVMISPGKDGLKIKDFVDGSPAIKSGLKEGDIITQVDGTSISTMKELLDSLSDKKAGDSVVLIYSRDGKEHKTKVPLTSGSKTSKKVTKQISIERN